MLHFVRRLPSTFARVAAGEWPRNAAGALIGIGATGALTALVLGPSSSLPILMAPMGATAVLLFAVPASPLARPWAVLGGNVLSALIGLAMAMSVSSSVLVASLAVGAAIAVMSLLRCLHPPGGACALTAVLTAPQTMQDGFFFVLLPVLINSVLLVIAAIICNRALGRSYPHRAHATQQPHAHPANLLTEADFDAVLADYGEVLDISRKDLEMLYLELVSRADDKRGNQPR
ncbi:MAG: HPP family protein [Erythrobacter sp.]|nr:HPP family protein [Erythrobacter sp.]